MRHLRLLASVLLLVAATVEAGTFPVAPSANGRFLAQPNGKPFPILGRTAWFLTSLPVADFQLFLQDTADKGYTCVEFHAINHNPSGNNEPFAGNHSLPFLKQIGGATWTGSLTYLHAGAEAPDLTTPNTAYWDHVDAILDDAEAKGLLVFLFPAYTGYANSNQGWMTELLANGTTKVRTYGAWIAARYAQRPNIVWMLGGDMGTGSNPFTPAQSAVEQALLDGLKSVPGQLSTLVCAEWNSNSIATDQVSFGPSMNLNGAYSFSGEVNTYCRLAYAHEPHVPSFLLEEPYDEEGPDGTNVNPDAAQPVRRYQWWGWLSSIGGCVSGNGYIWPFNAGWKAHLNSQGAQDMARLNGFIRSIAWHNLVPAGLGGMGTLVTEGGSAYFLADYVSAAATPDGTLLVAYVPPAHAGPITIALTGLSGMARARWFNPVTGVYTLISHALPNTGTKAFTPPGNNGSGFSDWVLVLDVPAWSSLGNGKAGVAGVPKLVGSGNLVASQAGALVLGAAAPNADATLVLGLAAIDAPFKGGVLVPAPLLLLPLVTGPSGGATLNLTVPGGVPSGTQAFVQFWIEDASASFGLSASNALVGTVP